MNGVNGNFINICSKGGIRPTSNPSLACHKIIKSRIDGIQENLARVEDKINSIQEKNFDVTA